MQVRITRTRDPERDHTFRSTGDDYHWNVYNVLNDKYLYLKEGDEDISGNFIITR